MDQNCYSSRGNIISWINDILQIQMSKIEQLGSGSIYCHLLDAAFPQKVPLMKVKWNARLQGQFYHNFKILQVCFDHLGIEKYIDIQKLMKAKYQDNLEFIQWFRSYLLPYINNNNYNAKARRKNAQIYLGFVQKKIFITVASKQTLNNSIQKSNRTSMTKSISINNIKQNNSNYQTIQNKASLKLSQIESLKKSSFLQLSKNPCKNIKNISKKCINRNLSETFYNHRNNNDKPLKDIENIINSKFIKSNCLIIESQEDQS